MAPAALNRAPQFVAVVTLVIGTALTVAPRPTTAAMRLGDRPTLGRAIGVADLALVPGLLAGRPRWPWMLTRGVFNMLIAAVYRTEARRAGGQPGARAGMYAMLGLTVADTALAVALASTDG